MTGEYTLTVDPSGSGGGTKTYSSHNPNDKPLIGGDFTRTHTGLSDFVFEVPYNLNLEDNKTDEIHLESGSTFLFRGFIHRISNSERSKTCRIAGEGIEYELERDGLTFTSTQQLAHNAIDDFWSNETVFSPTVTAPSANQTVTDNQEQEANTNAEFNSLLTPGDTDPIAIQNSNIEILQSSDTREGENPDTSTNTSTTSDANASGGSSLFFDIDESTATFDFTPNYDIPEDRVSILLRVKGDDVGQTDFIFNGTTIDSLNDGATISNFQWRDVANDTAVISGTSGTFQGSGYSGGTLSAGTTQTLKIDTTTVPGGGLEVDVVCTVIDNNFSYTVDNDNGGSSGFLDGPELFPDQFEVTLSETNSSWNITDGKINSTWNDTSNNQRIQLRLFDINTWHPNNGDENNTSSIDTDFGSDVGSIVQGRARLSRFGSRTTATPQQGFNGQHLEEWEILIDGNDIPVFDDATFEGSEFEVAKELHERANMRFWMDHQANSKTVQSARAGDVTDTLPSNAQDGEGKIMNRTRTVDFRNYANQVTLRSKTSGGSRTKATVSDSGEISDFGTHHQDVKNPNIGGSADVEMQARRALGRLLSNREITGEIETPPVDVNAGPSYTNASFSKGNTQTAALEENTYTIQNGELRSRLRFEIDPVELSETLIGLTNQSRSNALGF